MVSYRELAVARRDDERGSALLVVLVLAAIVAIMLYRELPIAAFEAQRQKEELLISRGNEYKRGVKLFVRKVGRFPSTIEELENTNRMRFLRHRYVDPLTGKDDWRMIHAGPGGVIIDSKVQSALGLGKGANALGQGAVFAGFNNTFSGDATAIGETAAPNAALRQRPPATKNAGGLGQDGLPPITGDTAADLNGVAGNGPGQPGPGQPGQAPTDRLPFDPATGQAYPANLPGQNVGLPPNAQTPTDSNAAGSGIGSLAQQLSNVNPKTPEQAQNSAFGNNNSRLGNGQNAGALGGTGQIGGAGGLAGVASKATGKSIKTVNDQAKYSLWEFYYDLRKDQTAAASGGMPQNVNNGLNTTNGRLGQTNGSAFGQTQQSGPVSSGFGSQPGAQPTPQDPSQDQPIPPPPLQQQQ